MPMPVQLRCEGGHVDCGCQALKVPQEHVLQLLGAERQTGDLRVAQDVDEVSAAQQQRELAEVHLGHQHAAVAAQDVAEVGRQRAEVAQVRGGRSCGRACAPGARAAPIGPYVEPQPSTSSSASPVGSSTSTSGDGDAVDLRRAQPDHPVVVGRVVGDRAAAVGLLQPADPVLQPRRAGHGPGPGERVVVAQVGPERRCRPGTFGPVANAGSARGSADTSGTCHGSEPLATEPSDSTITGVR